jgi:preprotein translocase subunit SecF
MSSSQDARDSARDLSSTVTGAGGRPVARTAIGRLLEEQTAIDFVGRRMIGLTISGVLIVITAVSLFAQGLNQGIDFTGGISWDVPAGEGFTADDAESIIAERGLATEGARIQERSSDSGDFVKVQVQVDDSEAETVGQELRRTLADAAEVDVDDVNVNLVSSSWGSDVTEKAIRALAIFLVLVAIYISLRFEWRMAVAAIIAMLHDVLISVGIYSLFQFVVTPATLIAFLTILGYSLYDTIVVFDRVKENEARFGTVKPPFADVLNVSMNQVLMRSLNTTLSSVVPVISLLLVGSAILGQQTLEEFALALLIGMLTGTYSSIFVAVPLLAFLKRTDPKWRATRSAARVTGEPLREMVVTGNMLGGRRARTRTATTAATAGSGETASSDGPSESSSATLETIGTADPTEAAKRALSHPPRPRKKTRR